MDMILGRWWRRRKRRIVKSWWVVDVWMLRLARTSHLFRLWKDGKKHNNSRQQVLI
jgi:hypothetical protein